MGYIEVWSSSHKMRSAGNKIGLPLPLVAPVKGFSEHLWGKTFIEVASSVGLSLPSRSSGPLLPAPCADGTWSDRYLSNKEVADWYRLVLSAIDSLCGQAEKKIEDHKKLAVIS